MCKGTRLLLAFGWLVTGACMGLPEDLPSSGDVPLSRAALVSADPADLPPSELLASPLPSVPGLDLVGLGVTFSSAAKVNEAPIGDMTAWLAGATLPHTSASPFGPRLKSALGLAETHAGLLDAGVLQKVFELLEDFEGLPGFSFDINAGKVTKTRFGYPPTRARWLHAEWDQPGLINLNKPIPAKRIEHPDPFVAKDIRLRGARLYCSARAAFKQQGPESRPMGQQVGFKLNVLGERIDFLVVEPRVGLAGPVRFDAAVANPGASADGAQAFAVPMLLGTRVTPIRAFGLPSLGEVQVPVTLVTGDSEILTKSDFGAITTGGVECTLRRVALEDTAPVRGRQRGAGAGRGGPVGAPVGVIDCRPRMRNEYRREHITVTHADAMLSTGLESQGTIEVPLLFLGPLEIRLTGKIGIGVGLGKDVPARVQGAPGRIGWLSSNGDAGLAYHDGVWSLNVPAEFTANNLGQFGWAILDDFLPIPKPGDGWFIPVLHPFFWPAAALTLVRPNQADDHQIEVKNGLELGLGVKAKLIDGISFGPFEIKPEVSGGLTGSVSQGFRIRDALAAQSWGLAGPAMPVTSVVVEPFTSALATFDGITASVLLKLDLWLRTIKIRLKFPVVPPFELASWQSDQIRSWPEPSRLRLGTGGVGAFGFDMRTRPFVASHLPSGADHMPFVSEDVPACLAVDDVGGQPAPAPCAPIPGAGGGAVPGANFCLYTGVEISAPWTKGTLPALPAGAVCPAGTVRQAYLAKAGDQAQKACLEGMLNVFCAPISKQQSFQGASVLARILPITAAGAAEAFLAQVQAAADACVQAYVQPSNDAAELDVRITTFAEALLKAAGCDDTATLISGEALVTGGGRESRRPGPIEPAAACH
jgi:hypothetical protein